jgi:hypothetical protein
VKQEKWGTWKYKIALGAELIVGFGNENQGIGSGSELTGLMTGASESDFVLSADQGPVGDRDKAGGGRSLSSFPQPPT